MELFFDSGATKCDAILLDDNGHYLRHCTCEGINATYMRDDEMESVLAHLREQTGSDGFQKATFSGAGCGNPNNAQRIGNILERLYPTTETEVISDLLGACRLLCPGQSGMVAILGTGASACLYDGTRITCQAPSLGYLLGDEGSGTHIGKLLLQRYLRGELPDTLVKDLERTFSIDKAEVIRRLYREPFPNRFLASFAQYLGNNRESPCLRDLLKEAFNDFFRTQIIPLLPYNIYIIHLMGSVSYHFKDLIGEVAIQHGVTLGKTAASPLEFLRR